LRVKNLWQHAVNPNSNKMARTSSPRRLALYRLDAQAVGIDQCRFEQLVPVVNTVVLASEDMLH
jgi:hypothetical protein